MKIKIKSSKKVVQSPWHQDFVNREALPDIKLIRTQFFLNFVALMLPLIVAVIWIQKEVSLSVLKSDIAKLEGEKAGMQASNNDLVSLSRDFLKESAKIEALDEFYYNLFPSSEFMAAITEMVPEEIIISSIKMKKANRVNGNKVIDIWESQIVGYDTQTSPDAATKVNSFAENLEKIELFSPYIEEAVLENLNRDQATNTLNFTISLAFSDLEKDLDKPKEVVQ